MKRGERIKTGNLRGGVDFNKGFGEEGHHTAQKLSLDFEKIERSYPF